MSRAAQVASAHPSGVQLLIMEPHSGGHRACYVRWLVDEAKARGWPVVVVTADEHDRTATMNCVENMVGDPGRFISRAPVLADRSTEAGLLGGMLLQLRYFRWFQSGYADVSARLGPVRVVVPYVDYFIDIAGLLGSPFGSAPWVGITMRSWSAGAGGPVRTLQSRLLRRLACDSRLRALFSINPTDTRRSSSVSGAGGAILRPLLDPAELSYKPEKYAARDRLGLPRDALVLLVFGTVDQRKGVRHLLEGIGRLDADRRPTLLLVGRQSDEIRNLLSRAQYDAWRRNGRIFEVNQFVDDEAQGLAFAASDVVWVGYVGHRAMSGVLVLAGVAGLPVIGCQEGEIGQLVRGAGIGLVVDVEQPDSVAAALFQMHDPNRRSSFGNAARCAFKAHTPKVFGGIVLDAIGIGP